MKNGKLAGADDRGDLVREALAQIRELRARLAESQQRHNAPIAVVGMSCRFPKADGPDAYWRVLADAVDAVTEIPRDRWDIDAYYDPDPDAPGKMYTRHGGFIEDVDQFDPHAFGISPLEAAAIDPQHRLLLEVAWEALEDAGIPADRLFGTRTGVFLGLSNSDYGRLILGNATNVDVYASTGVNYSVAAGRLSYVLGLQGPSMVVDTACSSSLVAVHLACQSLRAGESKLALVGGVNLILFPEIHVNFCRARMLAPDGRCKTFDAAADGYVRGEGGGVVVLKRLDDALASGDRVRAVIRGAAVNQDGRSSGLTVPNGPSQEAVIRTALENAALSPADIDYVEAHGTGTSLGDPIELRALGASLGAERPEGRPLLVGSVKTNIGHLEAAAGIAGLIKVVLALEREEIPAQLHFERLNPHFDPGEWPLEVVTERRPWPKCARRRVAGVSSFGFSGTNAHVVVEEPPPAPLPEPRPRPWHAITLSGRTRSALGAVAERLARHLRANRQLAAADVAYSANAGRAHMAERAAVVVQSIEAAADQLEQLSHGSGSNVLRGRAVPGVVPEVVFLFPGQGAHFAGMARQLYETQPVVSAALERCQDVLRDELERPLLDVIFDPSEQTLEDMAHAQPALFAVEWALAELWRSWGVHPAAVVGHSAGEYVAACVAGVMGLEDGLRLVAARGRLMSGLPSGGAMATIFAPAAEVEETMVRLGGGLTLAAINGPAHVVVSGEATEVARLLAEFEAKGTTGKLLRISNAYHSSLVEPMLPALEERAARVQYRAPELELISNLTGRAIEPGEIGPGYWREHARRPVQFLQSVLVLGAAGHRVFLEVGPGSTLLGIAQEALDSEDKIWLPSIRRSRGEWEQILETAATLHLSGVGVDWESVDRPYARGKVALPTYPFERERCWSAAAVGSGSGTPAAGTLWDEGMTAGHAQAGQAPLDLAIASFPEKWASLERLTTAFQVAALREIGAFDAAGSRETGETLCDRFGISAGYLPLLRRWLSHLAEDGVLRRVGDAFVAERALSAPAVAVPLREAEEALGDYRELFEYVARCGPRLAAVLTGRESALETLFPGGDFSLAEGLYRTSPVSRYLNAIARAVVEAAGRAAATRDEVRILEIGAGTGGTTSAVLSALPPDRTAYVFTDVSDLFLDQAQARFAGYPFLRFARLDIEQNPVEQGFTPGSFDVTIAANVLHATRDLRQTLMRARELAAPGGLLVMSETTTHHRVFDITTGLIEGWQLFSDDLRGDNPLLSTEQWLQLLQDVGFEHAAALPEPGGIADALGNRIIVAAAPGDGKRASNLPAPGVARGETGVSESEGEASGTATNGAETTLLTEFAEALPSERSDLLARHVRRRVMELLRLGDRHTPGLRDGLSSLGVDSLMALQLRNRLAADIGMKGRLSATLVFDHPSCEAVGAFLQQLLDDGGAAEAPDAPVRTSPPGVDADGLTEEQAEAELLERLDSIERGKQ